MRIVVAPDKFKGSLDAAEVAAAVAAGLVAVAGRSTLTARELAAAGIGAVYPLTSLEPDPGRCHTEAAVLLRQAGQMIAHEQLTKAVGRA